MSVKNNNKSKILEYLSDPENDFLTRSEISITVLGYKQIRSIYKQFSPVELSEIEAQAFEERKRKSVRRRCKVYDSLYNEAIGGNVQAAKEFLDRTEGKVKEKPESSEDQAQPVKVVIEVKDASNR